MDEIQEAELKLFRLALKDEISETEKSNILNEFSCIQMKLQNLLEDLVTKNKELVQVVEHHLATCIYLHFSLTLVYLDCYGCQAGLEGLTGFVLNSFYLKKQCCDINACLTLNLSMDYY